MDAYLEIMHAFLSGQTSEAAAAAALERAGFAPPAGAKGTFGVYRELVTRQWRSVLDHFYRAARALAEGAKVGSWDALASEFHRAHPPTHGNPNAFCLPFAGFLEHRGASPELIELADFAAVRYRAMHAPHAARVVLEVDVFPRSYAFDVVRYSRAIEKGGDAPAALAPAATTVIVGRSRHTGALTVLRASVGALVALLEATRDDDDRSEKGAPALPPGLTPGLTSSIVLAERATLVAEGLVP